MAYVYEYTLPNNYLITGIILGGTFTIEDIKGYAFYNNNKEITRVTSSLMKLFLISRHPYIDDFESIIHSLKLPLDLLGATGGLNTTRLSNCKIVIETHTKIKDICLYLDFYDPKKDKMKFHILIDEHLVEIDSEGSDDSVDSDDIVIKVII